MQRYIDQLIEDLREKHKVPTPPELTFLQAEDSMEAYFENVDKYLSGEHDQRIGEALGLIPEQFPPTERLTINQMHQVSKAFSDLLFSWNVCADMPDGLPADMAYRLWVSTLNMEAFLPEDGFVTLEFCHYDPDDCPFDTWCRCNHEPDQDQDSSDRGDDFPF